MAADPVALQLRLLQTVAEVAAGQNSRVIIVPVPVEMLPFLDRAASAAVLAARQRRKLGPSWSFKRKSATTRLLTGSPRGQLCASSTNCRTAAVLRRRP